MRKCQVKLIIVFFLREMMFKNTGIENMSERLSIYISRKAGLWSTRCNRFDASTTPSAPARGCTTLPASCAYVP